MWKHNQKNGLPPSAKIGGVSRIGGASKKKFKNLKTFSVFDLKDEIGQRKKNLRGSIPPPPPPPPPPE
jgi:hypothetical protein